MKRSFDVGEWNIRSDDPDGRTVEGRIVPYNQIETVVQRDQATGELVKFKEQFLPGSCLAMVQAAQKRGSASWIALLMEHNEYDFDANVGFAHSLESREDGAYAVFRLHDGNDLPKVRSMLRESHTGLSVSFADTRPPKIEDGLVSRRQVHINHVAATPTPVYSGAKVLAMRADNDDGILSTIHDTPNLDSVKEWLAAMKGANA
jgi:HK97 family phage prohead protease